MNNTWYLRPPHFYSRAAIGWLGIACLSVSLAACGSGKGDAKPDSTETDKPAAEPAAESHASVTATTEKVELKVFTEVVDAAGVVAARTGHFAALAAPGPTRISAIRVALGSRVRRGDTLVSFETTTFDAAVASADAALTTAEQAAARARRLVDAGVSPRRDAELAAAELAAARASSTTAHRAQQLATLQSPIDGVVTKLAAVLGANADVGQTLVEVSDTRALDVLLTLSPTLVSGVRTGQAVALTDGGTADAASLGTGRVADISAVIDSVSRGVTVRVSVTDQKRTLRIGESVYGHVELASRRDAIVVSDNALVPAGEGFQVFVVDDSSKAHARPVVVGARSGHAVWIREGLKVGETIVTAGAYGLDDGVTVVAKKP